MRAFLIVLLLALVLPAVAEDTTSAPETAPADPPATGLMPRQQQMLLEGRGMGLARAAEMNGYPGPMHVLQQADALALSDEQRAASAALLARVRAEAPALGQRIVTAEAELNALFADGTVTPEALQAKLAEIADLNAELRAVHLNAHLEQAALLSDEQKAAYQPMHGNRRGQGPGGMRGEDRPHPMRQHGGPGGSRNREG